VEETTFGDTRFRNLGAEIRIRRTVGCKNKRQTTENDNIYVSENDGKNPILDFPLNSYMHSFSPA
jgi:hypothetical protein